MSGARSSRVITEHERDLARRWRLRADRLDEHARRLRREGDVHGAGSAEDAEQAATEYRIAADELEAAGGDS